MDYQAEQEMETEALEAILMEDLRELHEDLPEGWPSSAKCYSVAINPETEGAPADTSENECRAELVFAHTPTYPDEPPLYKARSLRGLSDADMAALAVVLDEQVEANIGMAMIYAMVAAAKEWLQDKVSKPEQEAGADPAAARKAAEEAEERRLAELRSHGTMVSPATFAEWKARFNAEVALARARLRGEDGAEKKDKGPTGKQFFLRLEADGKEAEPEEADGSTEDDEDFEGEDEDFEEEEEEDDELLDEYLASKK